MTIGKLLFITLVAVACQMYSGFAIEMEVTPKTFISGVTTNVTLKCVPGDTIDVLSNIVVFQLSKDGTLLATGKPDGVILSETLRTSKYSVTDQIDVQNLSNSFLLFTIQFPEAEDEGSYSCHMNYEDKDGFFQNADCSLPLKQNVTDDTNVQNQLEQTLQLVDNLMKRVSLLEDQVFDQITVNNNQSRKIAALTEKASNPIGFYASLSNPVTIAADDVVVFDQVQFNTGDGFNQTSGAFVVPSSGFYSLSLVCEVESQVAIRMEMKLMVNDKTIMKLFITGGGTASGGQQSGSLVYDLQAGSQVKVVVGKIQTQSATDVRILSENLSYLSGYFLG